MPLPDFVIIGAQKSASTFLRACLNDHPDIYLPYQEIPFFESPDYDTTPIASLEALFDGKTQKHLGIKRPNYLAKPEVAERLQRHLPTSRLIAVLRNPVDRAVSAYFHYINGGTIPPLDIETGMRCILDDPTYRSRNQRCSEIIEFGFYAKNLLHYQYFVDKERLLILFHEDIAKNPVDSVQKAYRFIGADDNFVPNSRQSRPMKVTYNLKRLKFLNRRHKYTTVYNKNRTRRHAKKMNVRDYIAAGSIMGIDKLFLSKVLKSQKPILSSDLQQRLLSIYEKDICDLEKFTDRDLSSWKKIP